MPPLTVDPGVLSGAGESIKSVSDQIAAAIGTLETGLAGGARSGLDPAGLAFGHTYQQSAQGLLDAAAKSVNAGRSIGFGVQMSASNYSGADAASTIGGGTSSVSPPDKPAEFNAPAAPSALGGGVPPPLLWSVIQTFIPDVWPDGDPAALRANGSAWQGFASALNGIVGQLAGPSGIVAGQQIPESGQMTSAISTLTQSLSEIASEAGKLATQTLEFADDVENTQNSIRDLLDRVSPSGLLDGFMSVINGDALEELKKVAEDVKTVLGDYWRQSEGRRDILQIGMGMIDDAIVSVEEWARREFPKYLGDDVGNALATGLDFQMTLGQGLLAGGVDLVESVGQFDPTRFAYDPQGAKDAWAGMAESLGESLLYATPTGIMANPSGAFNHYKDQVTDAVHAEDWSSDRPGYGLGKIFFDVGAAAVPGGAALRGTKVAAEAADVATPGQGRVPDVPTGALDNLAPIGARADEITSKLDNLDDFGDNVPTTPMAAGPDGPSGPAIPPPLAEPPGVGDAPSARVPDSSTSNVPGSATPHVPDATPSDRSTATPTAPTPGPNTHSPLAVDDAAPRGGTHPTGMNSELPPAPAAVDATSPSRESAPPAAVRAPDLAPDQPHQPQATAASDAEPNPRVADPTTPHQPEHGSGGSDTRRNDDDPSGASPSADEDPSPDARTEPDPPAPRQDPPQAVEGQDYPLSPENAVRVLENPVDEIARLHEGGVPTSVTDGYDPLAGRTVEQFLEEFAVQDANGNFRWDWDTHAPNDGFAGPPSVTDRIPADLRLDRLGNNDGKFMAEEGAPMASRAMPPGAASQYHVFQGTGNPIPDDLPWEVRYGPAKDAFGQPGGANQWVVVDTESGRQVPITDLIRKGLLTDVTPPRN